MKISKILVLLLVIACLGVSITAQIDRKASMKIVAGGHVAGAGTTGLALDVPLEGPTGVAVGRDGSMYVSEFQGGRVRKIDSAGQITTVTGGGLLPSGESGPAQLSNVMGPAALVFDRKGNLYIAEQLGNRVSRINKKGIMSTFAGNGTQGPTADGARATSTAINGPNGLVFDQNGNLYVSEFLGNRIRKITPDGIITTVAGTGRIAGPGPGPGDGGPAASAGLSGPTGLTMDAKGNLYVAEIIGNRVRRIDRNGVISTVVPEIFGPSALSFDHSGNLIIAEHFGQRIRKLDSAGNLTTVMTTDVYGVTVDNDDVLHIAQILVGRVARVEAVPATSATGVETFALKYEAGVQNQSSQDNRSATQANLKMPAGVTYDKQGNFYIAEVFGNRVRKVDSQGTITTIAGTGKNGFSGDGGPAVNADLNGPGTLGFDPDGNLYIVEIVGNRVRKIDTNGVIQTIAGTGEEGFSGDNGPATQARFNHVHWGGFDKATGSIYLVDTLNYRIRQIDRNGIVTTVAGTGEAKSAGDGGTALQASFNRPENLAIDAQGNWFISEGAGHRIRKINKQGIVSTVAGTGKGGYSGDGRLGTHAKLNGPTGLAIDDNGYLYIADSFNSVVRRLDPDGTIHLVLGTPGQRGVNEGPASQSLLVSPWGLAIKPKLISGDGAIQPATDQAPPSGDLLVSDSCPAAVSQTEPPPSGGGPASKKSKE